MEEIIIETKDFLTKAGEAIGTIPLEIKFKKLDEKAVVPTYAHYGDVGMDITAIDVEYDEERDIYIYRTGLAFESDFHYGQFLFPRSSNRKTDAYLCNSVGIADSAIYRGEILFCYKNRDSVETIAQLAGMNKFFETLVESGVDIAMQAKDRAYNEVLHNARLLKYAPYKVGEKIGQMVFAAYPYVQLIETDTLSTTERGSGGFGSTGN